jgi:hypothetical protein
MDFMEVVEQELRSQRLAAVQAIKELGASAFFHDSVD